MIKIISGGQTGVDQGALKAAYDSGFEIGGYCPPGRVCENGIIPDVYPLIETKNDRSNNAPGIPRSERTELNVLESDGTLIIIPSDVNSDLGTNYTLQCCKTFCKPSIIIDPLIHRKSATKCISNWITNNKINIINVAGPSESQFQGIHRLAFDMISDLLATYTTNS